ncbi:MAG TPA: glycosyltransferase family 4 protein [Bacteroidia bacterium]
MRILFVTLGNELVASSRTRVFQYLPHLKLQGATCRIIQYESSMHYLVLSKLQRDTFLKKLFVYFTLKLIHLYNYFYSFLSNLQLIYYCSKYDVVFIQKALPPVFIQKILQKKNPNIVFDFDDAIYADKISYEIQRFDYLCSHVKLAVIENDNTGRYMHKRGIRTVKITGPIDCGRYKPKENADRARKKIIIGWIGSASTTDYLKMIAKPLQYISAKYEHVTFMLIGAKTLQLEGCKIQYEEWNLQSEVSLLEQFDIGIMPLPDNEWTQGKGGYKLLQYMAMGIPCITSPVGVNKEMVADGQSGFWAEPDSAWIESFEKLITDDSLRASMGKCARKIALDKYSFEVSTPRLYAELQRLAEV